MTNWKYNIGDNVIDNKRNITITNREIRYMSSWKKPHNMKWIEYQCNKCNYTGWVPEKSIGEGKGCLGCNGKKVINGINDINTKAPDIVKYLLDKEDAYRYKPYSASIIKTKCPFCGDIRDYRISQLTSAPYVCHRCGKNTSLAEKLFYAFLKFYNVDFIFQLSSKNMSWCGKYRYDFYIPSINTIIEIHGKQHFSEKGIYNRTYSDIHKIDLIKYDLAIKNGIKNYCIIPVINTTKKALINSIYISEIAELLNINKDDIFINLEKIYTDLFSNRSIDICKYYMQHQNLSAIKIAEIFDVSSPTVLRALHEGTESGLCNYNGQKRLKETLIRNTKKSSKPIEIICPNGHSVKFDSIREAERLSQVILGMHFSRFFIKKYCNDNEDFKGYKFKFL